MAQDQQPSLVSQSSQNSTAAMDLLAGSSSTCFLFSTPISGVTTDDLKAKAQELRNQEIEKTAKFGASAVISNGYHH